MFTKFVEFKIHPIDVARVIETMSHYRYNSCDRSDLHVEVDAARNGNMLTYSVSLHCRKKELGYCLNDILRLNREGVYIERLIVS